MNICALASPKNTDVEQRSPCQSFPQQKWPGNQRCQQWQHGSCCFELAGKEDENCEFQKQNR